MAKATDTITLTAVRDIQSVTWYYQLKTGTSAPAKPTASPPPSPWQTTEPSYTAGDTKYLFIVERTVYTDGTFEYTTPSLSSSYEAAKQAYNEAQNAKKTATNFMSSDSSGIMVADMRNGTSQTPSNPSGRNVLIDSDSIDIRNGSDVLASFGSTAVIGQEGESQVQIDYNSLQMIDKEGNIFFVVSDLRDRSGTATVEESFTYRDTTMLTFQALGIVKVVADGTTLSNTDYSLGPNGQDVTINVSYDEVKITYTTNRIVTAYTLGDRHRVGRVGANSVAMGRSLIASGPFAVALGSGTEAGGRSSLASGVATRALGNNSAALGSSGVATGFGSATFGYGGNAHGMFSFVDGEDNVANGRNSHAMGRGTIAQYESQTVMGRYNVADTSNKNALIIGNGASDDSRSNGFAVGWNGVPSCRNQNGDYGTIFDLIYPVGSIYMSVNSVSPATLFGGTWERIQDRFLLAAGSNYAAGGTGGSADASLPAHTHTVSGTAASNGAHTHTVSGTAASNGAHTHSMKEIWSDGSGSKSAYTMSSNRTQTTRSTASAGAHTHTVSGTAASNGAHTHTVSGTAASQGVAAAGKNMPPYLSVYVWKRTA